MKRRLIILVLVLGSMLLAGCGPAVRERATELALEWVAANAAIIGSIEVTGSSTDDDVDAAMGAREVIENMLEAEKLMEEGRKENDLGKMEQAIEKRPGDYTYRSTYSAALLKAGRTKESSDQLKAGFEAAEKYGGRHLQLNAIAAIQELDAMRLDFAGGGVTKDQCMHYYGQLSYLWSVRAYETKQQADLIKSDSYHDLSQSCK